MKDYLKILSDAGVELTDEQKSTIKTEFAENYRTKADYDKVVTKRDEYKSSLDDVTDKLSKANEDSKANQTTAEELQAKIKSLSDALESEKNTRETENARRALEATVDEFLNSSNEDGSKKYAFMNEITKDHYRNALLDEMGKDTAKGKSLADMLAGLTTDADGNQKKDVFIDKAKSDAEAKKARFTTPMGNGNNNGDVKSLKGMSYADRLKLKATSPEEYEARKTIK